MRLELLIAHNKYRGLVSNPYPESMPAVVWDDYLEKETQKYTDKCIFEHSTSAERQYFVNPSPILFLFSLDHSCFLKGRDLCWREPSCNVFLCRIRRICSSQLVLRSKGLHVPRGLFIAYGALHASCLGKEP